MDIYERTAKEFHDTYERLAPEYGYETRRESAVPWEQVPEQNRALMVAVVRHVMRGAVDPEYVARLEELVRAAPDYLGARQPLHNGWIARAEALVGELGGDLHLERGAVSDLETAVRLLNDATTTIIDTDLRREWEAERARLRAVVADPPPARGAVDPSEKTTLQALLCELLGYLNRDDVPTALAARLDAATTRNLDP